MDFIISDNHWFHSRIIKYENRPFKDVNEMNMVMKENWNNNVPKNARVFNLGDIAFTRYEDEVLDLLHSLNGNITIIPGNHDKILYDLFMAGKYNDNRKKLYIAPPIHELKVDVGYNKYEKVVLCHYPIYSYNGAFHNRLHFYGHVHSRTNLGLKNSFNISVEEIGYYPLLFRDVLSSYKEKYNI